MEGIGNNETVNRKYAIDLPNMGDIKEKPTEAQKNRVTILADEKGIGIQQIHSNNFWELNTMFLVYVYLEP